ncbi:MAG: hypothetical protein LBO09_05520 [Candidatus Peribacteria bacterium]|jgi:hypothetical protein|nr:hypothetical protein [Candidatus Peribacteria bacterium]
MPNEQNIMRKYSLDSIGVPYENIYPPLKDLDITNENRAKFPEYYYIPDVPDYTQSYKKEYLQNSI